MSVAHIQCTSLHEKPAPSCPQYCGLMLLSRRQVPCAPNTSVTCINCASPTKKLVPRHPPPCSPMLPSPCRVRCTLNTSVTHVECASLTKEEASAQLPSVPCTFSAMHA
mmetsp:Transcript_34345/g.89776  ORF Transcript_34345/g.89776 Transcript_34345/m.89776 type:complete len:109 (-) Transcript_34345:78-404(-)